jgi:hypothetical protein
MFSKIPVSVGTIKDPQKNTSHMQRNVVFTVFRKGIGKAITVATALIITQRPKDYLDL